MKTIESASIVIIESNSMIIEGYVNLLRRDQPSTPVAQHASVAAAIAAMAAGPPPMIVILNYDLAGGSSLKGLATILRHYESAPVVLVDAPENAQAAMSALNAGASGYISKTMKSESILQSLRLVMLGEKYLPPFCATGYTLAGAISLGTEKAITDLDSPIATLSPRRRQILTLVAAGASNKVIARTLSVHEVTVKSHLRMIFRTLGVNTRTQAARLAMCAGLSLPPVEYRR